MRKEEVLCQIANDVLTDIPSIAGLAINGTASPKDVSVSSGKSSPRKLVRQKDVSHALNGGVGLETCS